jgi:hypothetical protein
VKKIICFAATSYFKVTKTKAWREEESSVDTLQGWGEEVFQRVVKINREDKRLKKK